MIYLPLILFNNLFLFYYFFFLSSFYKKRRVLVLVNMVPHDKEIFIWLKAQVSGSNIEN